MTIRMIRTSRKGPVDWSTPSTTQTVSDYTLVLKCHLNGLLLIEILGHKQFARPSCLELLQTKPVLFSFRSSPEAVIGVGMVLFAQNYSFCTDVFRRIRRPCRVDRHRRRHLRALRHVPIRKRAANGRSSVQVIPLNTFLSLTPNRTILNAADKAYLDPNYRMRHLILDSTLEADIS